MPTIIYYATIYTNIKSEVYIHNQSITPNYTLGTPNVKKQTISFNRVFPSLVSLISPAPPTSLQTPNSNHQMQITNNKPPKLKA